MLSSVILRVFVSVILCGQTFSSQCGTKELNKCKIINNTTLQCKNHIPTTVPALVNTVYLECLGNRRVINKTTFEGRGWSGISNLYIGEILQSGDLTFKNECFSGLSNLTEFRIRRGNQVPHVEFETNMFDGLEKLITLDLKGLTISHEAFVAIFNSETILPNIEELLLSGFGMQAVIFPLDDKVFDIIKSRPIRKLELSYMDVSDLNFTAFEEFIVNSSLEYFNLSHTILHNEQPKPFGHNLSVLKHLKTLDATGIVLPLLSGECKMVVNVSNVNWVPFSIDGYDTFSRADTAIIDEFCQENTENNYKEFRNITNVFIATNVNWNWRKVYFNNNNLNVRVFDVEIICADPTLELFSYTNNQLEYVSPKTFACIHTLKDLNLSGNKLYKMNNKTPEVFEKLFTALYKLENISLSNNQLKSIPFKMFINNTKIIRINLSTNMLKQIHFNLSSLFNLEILDVSSNKITQLNEMSRRVVDSLFLTTGHNHANRQLDLRGNPLSCGKCSDMASIKWILSRESYLKGFRDITCINEHQQSISVTNGLVADIEKICNRPVMIRYIVIIGTTTAVTVLVVSLLVITLVRRKRRRKKKEDRVRLIHEGQDEYEFVVFLSYSSDDHGVVSQNVITPLSEKLKEVIGIDRELISAGDRHFRAGRYIHNETIECLKRSAVALFVVSDNFTRSTHCMNEFEEAYKIQKPVVLITLGRIDISNMSAAMKELYNSKTRIIFAKDGNEFVLQTSWQNVCESILDVMH